METISIAGKDKKAVLIALYNRARVQGLGFLHAKDGPMTKEEAAKWLEKTTYFDYVNGRVLKVNLSGDELRPQFYDRDNGEGAAESALREAGLL